MGRRDTPPNAERDELPRTLALALEPWFLRGHRDMPWRRTRDPYAIWVSEIMLQQTRVETVQRYFEAFMERFPTVEALAAADEQAVLAAWSGLGYYRRARLLHRGARHVVQAQGGQIPSDAEGLRAIPGVGEYTAGAIASIAFDRPVPLVDGNVARVLSRIEAIEDPRQQVATARRHWQRVEAILQGGTPRVLSQALMELGATVCTPRSPQCSVCPVREVCGAHRDGRQDRIPAPRKKIASPTECWLALAITWRGRVLMVRRPAEGLLADLWCLPLVSMPAEGKDLAAAAGEALGGVRWSEAPLPMVRHVFTHRIWELHPLVGRASRKPRWPGLPDERQCWLEAGQAPPGGLPRVASKLLERIDRGWGRP
ncbi:A/G-specific adenine glycosylase [Paraliomyxa miuraensis]|uniref:A/G-specific adenine glycosylase n=1 Tax=Paraliomyxa miuraensis TaxID=376150 RepID=UPI00225888A8|nr:A/G-specific adenine glycosylase [Paraliomyxa miuraensis]MCX4242137.1 A/G-specific adenine glycosylase [Paraliomyxa miuraensis]